MHRCCSRPEIGGVTVRFKSAVAIIVGAVLVPAIGEWAPAGSTAVVTVRIQGPYHLVSTDCYFSAGSCTEDLVIVDHHGVLSAEHDRLFHGHVHGGNVTFGETWPEGMSEDSWWCTGTTTNQGQSITGTMTDGIGGSGTFTMTAN